MMVKKSVDKRNVILYTINNQLNAMTEFLFFRKSVAESRWVLKTDTQ